MPPIMANSNNGQDHMDKYFDTSRKILSQEITMCNMEALEEVMANVIFFLNWSNDKVKRLSTNKKDIHVKYQTSRTHCSKVISKVKVFKKWVKLHSQGHRVNNNGTHRKVSSQGILM